GLLTAASDGAVRMWRLEPMPGSPAALGPLAEQLAARPSGGGGEVQVSPGNLPTAGAMLESPGPHGIGAHAAQGASPRLAGARSRVHAAHASLAPAPGDPRAPSRPGPSHRNPARQLLERWLALEETPEALAAESLSLARACGASTSGSCAG